MKPCRNLWLTTITMAAFCVSFPAGVWQGDCRHIFHTVRVQEVKEFHHSSCFCVCKTHFHRVEHKSAVQKKAIGG